MIANASSGRLFAGFGVGMFLLFCFLPDSSTLFVSWPWVIFPQIALLLCPLALVLKLGEGGGWLPLGQGWDRWMMGAAIWGLWGLLWAPFRGMALWYGVMALLVLAIPYALQPWIATAAQRQRWFRTLGWGGAIWTFWSLGLWLTQTVWPEGQRLARLRSLGLNVTFDFNNINLRNWSPFGHQNYVAGFLVLLLPLWLGLAIEGRGKDRLGWSGITLLGLVALYTTSSRGGWLGLCTLMIIGVAGFAGRGWLSPKKLGAIVFGSGAILTLLIVGNNRWRSLILGFLAGADHDEFFFRWINGVLGWRMGLDHWWHGVGPGGVPLFYQHYRPFWAGLESGWVFQLHSTPVQLWAEWGIGFPLLGLWAAGLLGSQLKQWFQQVKNNPEPVPEEIWRWLLVAALGGYGVMALTDYQLDIPAITGLLLVESVLLLAILQPDRPATIPLPRWTGGILLGGILALGLNFVPGDRAWQASSVGFEALAQQPPDWPTFQRQLRQAQNLAPWEPYYAYQLGWNLGEKALFQGGKQTDWEEAIAAFEAGNQAAPYQEFGQTHLGWLRIRTHPVQAAEHFARAAQLLPAQHHIYFGLGISLLNQKQLPPALDAFALEILRDPSFITNGVWRSPNLAPLLPAIAQRLDQTYSRWLEADPENRIWHQRRGAIRWWIGDFAGTAQDWQSYGEENHRQWLALAQGEAIPQPSPWLNLWLQPEQRGLWLERLWWQSRQEAISATSKKQWLASLAQSQSFHQWITQKSPLGQTRIKRYGFGVVSRHIDGPQPEDYFVSSDNGPIALWEQDLFPFAAVDGDLDRRLQPLRDQLVQVWGRGADTIAPN